MSPPGSSARRDSTAQRSALRAGSPLSLAALGLALALALGCARAPVPESTPAPTPAPEPQPGSQPAGAWSEHVEAGRQAAFDLRFERAEEEFEHALDRLGTGPGDEKYRVLVRLKLASMVRNQYRFEEAETLLLELVQKERERDGPQLANALAELGLLYLQQEDGERGCPPLRESHAIRAEVFGPDHPLLAAAEHNLASCHRLAGRYEKAILLYQQALEKYGRLNQPLGASVALNNMALALAGAGDPEEAESFHERAIQLSERISGRGNVNQAKFTRDLATLLRSTGREREALELLRDSTRWFRESFGPAHREVVATERLIRE